MLLLHLQGNGLTNDLEKVVQVIKVYSVALGIKISR
jgi:hypothetical protein